MKHLKNFFQLNESQSKKIKDVLTFSVVLDWYNDNKDKIANIIGCKPDKLATEEELIEQSRGLVKNVINRQSGGNSGSENTEIAGFSSFKPFDMYILHDILHNIYDISKKDFNKSLNDIEFTESEVFEEIEVLCIEESFMKFCNIRYLKTDFINQNINQLVSFLMMAILKNDPTRIKDILDEKIKPYLEIYGVKYEIKEGNPYQNFFLSLKGNFRNMPRISNSEDFKNYMIKLINVGYGIDYTGGDRANYPDSNFYGEKENPTDLETSNIIDDLISSKSRFKIISTEDIYNIDDLQKMGITLSYDENYIEDIDFEDLSELKLPFNKDFLLENNLNIDFEGWFTYLSELSGKKFFERKGVTYLVFKKNNSYCLIDNNSFDEIIFDKWYEDGYFIYDSNHKFIDFEKYKKMSFEKVSNKLFKYKDSVSIMRRNFRDNDLVSNNTKLGSVSKDTYDYWQQEEIGVSKYYTDFSSNRKNKVSISKNVITNNGKKLLSVLNNIRGYSIKNYKELKNKYANKFTKSDISTYQYLDFYNLLNINNTNLVYNITISLTEHKIKLSKNYSTYQKINLLYDINSIISLISKINTKEDLMTLKSYITKNKIPKGIEETVNLYKKIENDILKNKEKFKKIVDFDAEIIEGKQITNDENFKLLQSKAEYKINSNYNILKEDIINIINKYYGEYDIDIKIPKYFISFSSNLEDIVLEIKNPPL